jgi:hypothetical protein
MNEQTLGNNTAATGVFENTGTAANTGNGAGGPNIMRAPGTRTNVLKIWAIIAMACDHLPYLSPDAHTEYYSFPIFLMHAFGRLTAPIFFYLVGIGYARTSNPNRYTARLLVFALLSYIPFVWYFHDGFPNAENFLYLNVIFTMLFGLLMLRVLREVRELALKIIGCAGCLVGVSFADYGLFGMAMILVFAYTWQNKKRMAVCFSAILAVDLFNMIVQELTDRPPAEMGAILASPGVVAYIIVLGCQFLPLILIMGHRDPLRYPEPRPGFFGKWLFYIFYPAHITIFLVLRLLLFGA